MGVSRNTSNYQADHHATSHHHHPDSDCHTAEPTEQRSRGTRPHHVLAEPTMGGYHAHRGRLRQQHPHPHNHGPRARAIPQHPRECLHRCNIYLGRRPSWPRHRNDGDTGPRYGQRLSCPDRRWTGLTRPLEQFREHPRGRGMYGPNGRRANCRARSPWHGKATLQ